jgi:hypothetical protein
MERKGIIVMVLVLMAGVSLVNVHAQDKIPEGMPIYYVDGSGISEDQARELFECLGIENKAGRENALVDEYELLSYVDTEKYQYVPTKILGAGELYEEGNRTVVEVLDIEAVKKIRAIPRDKTLERFGNALKKTGLLSMNTTIFGKHSKLIVCDYENETYISVNIDAKVGFEQLLDGFPLTGPGLKIVAVFDPNGVVTNLQ